jgi:putative hydrolase of the HAD superfamily
MENPATFFMKTCRAILWDVYGTLLVARRGDLDSLVRREAELVAAFAQTIRHFHLRSDAVALCRQFLAAIGTRRSSGGAHSEVRIEEIWQQIAPTAPPRAIALFFERHANPKRPMPGARETLAALKERGLRQGIVSNAQFYTRIELAELLGDEFFDPSLIFLSCELGVAKPDLTAFRRAAAVLARAGITPAECLMVGDSPVNDINPAREAGFSAILFGPGGEIQELPQLLERV